VAHLQKMGERQVRIDCDVIEADGGTRVASICGAYVALARCLRRALAKGWVKTWPLQDAVTAVSCGVVMGQVLLDLDYAEDSLAEVDANFVFSGSGGLIEIQATGEKEPFSQEALLQMLSFAQKATATIKVLQEEAVQV
jgi:ribonuclease PH